MSTDTADKKPNRFTWYNVAVSDRVLRVKEAKDRLRLTMLIR
jgi:hypothetical protein